MESGMPVNEGLVSLRDLFQDPANHAPRGTCSEPSRTVSDTGEVAPSVFDLATAVRLPEAGNFCVPGPGKPTLDPSPLQRSDELRPTPR